VAIGATPLVAGSEPTVGLVVRGAGIRPVHCRIVARPDAVLVEDEDGAPTFVNGHRVSGSSRLLAGDVLRLGTPGVELQLVAVEDRRGPASH
jgi:hypothetical protein